MTRWQRIFEKYDALSKQRALTNFESNMLELAIARLDGGQYGRRVYGNGS